MTRRREDCVYFRNEDGCKWCELGKTCSPSMINACSGYCKRLDEIEAQRVTELLRVWQYLYDSKAYEYCDIISREIGEIKGTVRFTDDI